MGEPLLNAREYLGTMPDASELNRLAENYPTYDEWEHRTKLLYGYFQGKSISELVDDKLHAKEIDKSTLSKQSLGGHSRWVKDKVKKTIIRILYLRSRLDEKMSRKVANSKLLDKFWSNEISLESRQSTIRKATKSPILDK